ncbi:hypothetical protein LguiA_019138 [Lonicera macranthoides]
MSTAREGSSGGGIDTTPFLPGSITDQIFRRSRRLVRRPPSLARFLRLSGGRRLMREPSMRVRESAAEQIEERQSDWAYSKPIVILDLIWNLAFVIASIVFLTMKRNKSSSILLRIWIIGYAVQCVIHMVCVSVEYKRRYHRRTSEGLEPSGGSWRSSNSSSGSDGGEGGDFGSERVQNGEETSSNKDALGSLHLVSVNVRPQIPSLAKHLESAITMFSFIWWIIGFYWVSVGGRNLSHDSPQLYWLCVTFLAFDVFFVVICVAVACVIGIAVCCCLPCIIAILYAVTDQEGATKEDIEGLSKYRFRRFGDCEKQNGDNQESFGGIMTERDTDSPAEHVLPLEDAECCICLCSYEDGAELRELPCRHHFHCTCIDKWLYINAICPLCKFNILKNGGQSGSEEV